MKTTRACSVRSAVSIAWRSGGKARTNRLAELAARREKLYADLVALEEQHQRGRIDERRYSARRQSLIAQLERVLGELDRTPAGGGEGLAA